MQASRAIPGGTFQVTEDEEPLPRIQRLDGFNEGWIEFESGEVGAQKGSTNLETVLKSLIRTNQ
jgi:hypothetical protein